MKIILSKALILFSFVSMGQSDTIPNVKCAGQIIDFIYSTDYIQAQKDSLNLEYPPSGSIDIYGTKMTKENRFSYGIVSSPDYESWRIDDENKNAAIFYFYIYLSYDELSGYGPIWLDLDNLTLWTSSVSSGSFSTGTVKYKKGKQIFFGEEKLIKLKECLDK